MMGKPAETADPSLWKLMNSLDQQFGGLHGINLGPLHVEDSCVAWFICGTSSSGIPGA